MAAASRDRPLGSSNFLVEFGTAKGTGFAEVVFAPFTIPSQSPANVPGERGAPDARFGALAANHLLLRRGATGELDLYAWWDQARRGRAPPRRIVRVKLLAADHATVLMTWRFRNVKPVSLAYSPLNALEGGLLMETLVLSFDEVEIA